MPRSSLFYVCPVSLSREMPTEKVFLEEQLRSVCVSLSLSLSARNKEDEMALIHPASAFAVLKDVTIARTTTTTAAGRPPPHNEK